MNLGRYASRAVQAVTILGLSLSLSTAPAMAQDAPAREAPAMSAEGPVPMKADVPAVEAIAEDVSAGTADSAVETAAAMPRMKPTEGVGMPTPGSIGLQEQHSDLGNYAAWIHDAILLPIIAIISVFVLFLLIWVVARYNRRANPVASKTSHNTLIEVLWTLIPVLILVGIAVPSIDLLAKQYKPAPKEALTVKVTGNQWYWSYSYPDNGEFEIVSYMLNLPGYPTINNGVREVGSDPSDGPAQFEVDNRLVLPVGEPIRMQVTAADVIHSFAIPSLWFKIDAVPGKINERVLTIDKPGVYYGQCSELCGPKHAYMPIAIEALPRDQWEAWVSSQPGGTLGDAEEAGELDRVVTDASAEAADEAEAADATETAENEAEAEDTPADEI